MTAAALGTRITIKALDSEETVDVRPGTQPGATLRIRGKGVPHLRGGGRGDQLVTLQIVIPSDDGELKSFAERWGGGKARNPRAGLGVD